MFFANKSNQDVLDDIGAIEHHWHSRWRVYPQNVTLVVTVSSVALADTFGAWTFIVPINTVPFDFEIIGLVVEQVNAATTYFIQFGYNPINAIPGINMELGERRFRITTVPIARTTELLTIRSQNIPANSSVWARLKTSSGNIDTADISVVIARHVEIHNEVPLWPAFPW